jgi:hypothetical protein
MGEEAANALETALADAGGLLVELEKFRASGGRDLAALRSEALALGDRARRLHGQHLLDGEAAASLLRDGDALIERLRTTLGELRDSPAYRAAAAAHGDGDHAALATLLPDLFQGLDLVPSPPPLFHPVPWLRRNRPRPAVEIAAEIARLRRDGIEAEGDALAWGVDPALPAVALLAERPSGDPVTLRFSPEALPPAVFRLADGGSHLVHVAVLSAPFDVLVPDSLDPEELGEISLDHARYRDELLDALQRAGVPASRA